MHENVLAVDLGFGWTKAKRGDNIFRQPSVIGEVRHVHREYIREDDIIYGNLEYFVGNFAVRHSNVMYYTVHDNKAETWTTKILLHSLLAKLSKDDRCFAVTGLPLDFYFKQKSQMSQFFDEFNNLQSYQVQFGSNHSFQVSTSINGYQIVPQPMGSAMNYLLLDSGELQDTSESGQIYVVADLGFHTFDLLVLDEMEIHKSSHSDTEISISNTYKLIQGYLRDYIGKSPNAYQLDMHILRGEYEGFDLTPLKEKAFISLAKQIELSVKSLNLNYYKLILTGGWSHEISKYLDVDRDSLIVFGQDGNIDGYKKIGRRLCHTLSNSELGEA